MTSNDSALNASLNSTPDPSVGIAQPSIAVSDSFVSDSLVSLDPPSSEQPSALLLDRPFRRVFEASIDGMVIADDTGRYVDANPAACALFGLPKEALLGCSLTDFADSSYKGSQVGLEFQHLAHYRGRLRLRRPDLTTRDVDYTAVPNLVSHRHLFVLRDVTEPILEGARHSQNSNHRQRQVVGQQFRETLDRTVAAITSCRVSNQAGWESEYYSAGCEVVSGFTPAELMADPHLWLSRIPADDCETIIRPCMEAIFAERNTTVEYRFRHKDGSMRWLSSTFTSCRDVAVGDWLVTAISTDVTDRKQAELAMRWAIEREQQAIRREHFINAITQKIRQLLDLDVILSLTVSEVRQFLKVDRAVICRFNSSDWSGKIVAEAVIDPMYTIRDRVIPSFCFSESELQLYRQGQAHSINNIHEAKVEPCYYNLLAELQVQAELVVPILIQEDLWGLLIVHRCNEARSWQQANILLLRQLSLQLAICIHQTQLHHQTQQLFQQVQQLSRGLELRGQEYTAQPQETLAFEKRLNEITDTVRGSLDEAQIWEATVQALAIELSAACCDATLHNLEKQTSIIRYESLRSEIEPACGAVIQMQEIPDIYPQILQGQSAQFCPIEVSTASAETLWRTKNQYTVLSCPIVYEGDLLGNLWIFRLSHQHFSRLETWLVQRVANQCAIALKQARLYQAAQDRVEELERLNRLKSDFCSTIAHELRTPISNIKLATKMLELSLKGTESLLKNSEAEASESITTESLATHIPNSKIDQAHFARYFQILKSECHREVNLIDSLLELMQLDAATRSLFMSTINLQVLLPHIVEPFIERSRHQKQHLKLRISQGLPTITTDLTYLERILIALLENTLKYTPPGESIIVSAETTSIGLQIHVSSTGVEISQEEIDRLFDKFYRIPNKGPWDYSGIGLGLALVEKLAERINASVWVSSANGQTTFTLQL